jgi:PqqD family protein of HPr-rel-A system
VLGGFGPTDQPRAVDDVETAVFEGDVVVYHESTGRVHQLNSTAGAVWLLCDGETSVEAMAVELGEIYAMAPDDLVEGIHQALNQIADTGLLDGAAAAAHARLAGAPDMIAADGSRILLAPPDP